MKRLLACLSLVLLLGACQQTMDADVTRFHTVPANYAGQSFTILPDKNQAGSLEFQHYAELVAAALQAQGLRPLPHEGPPADLVVQMHYASLGNHTDYIYDPGPYWGGWGWGGWGPGWGWGGYYDGSVSSYTLYAQMLDVEIFDGPAWRAGKREMAFEGRAVGQSEIRSLNVAMPYLVAALFRNFPGNSGQTIQVSVPIGGSDP